MYKIIARNGEKIVKKDSDLLDVASAVVSMIWFVSRMDMENFSSVTIERES